MKLIHLKSQPYILSNNELNDKDMTLSFIQWVSLFCIMDMRNDIGFD